MYSKKVSYNLKSLTIAISVFILCCLVHGFYFKSNMLDLGNLLAGIAGVVIAYLLLKWISIIKKPRH